ncbi:MAG: family 1 glycosylhydrolase [Clostridia bacterium]|nr:family 1 glycosylhydrolase [Clostridia bacterium]
MDAIRFKTGFSLGAASAATQVDGDCKNSNWYDWYQRGRIKDGSNPDIATGHRQRVEEDTELLISMGIRDYRFGLEWARIEPNEGEFSEEEFSAVRHELELLIKGGVRPLITIHHFSNPMWFEKQGGFYNRAGVERFLRMVGEVVQRLGDLVSEYITINEPNVYAMNGYFSGSWPPGKRSVFAMLRVIRNMGECHRRSYELIHELRAAMGYADTKVGYAHHMRAYAPKNPKNVWHRVCTPIVRYIFQSHISHSYLKKGGKVFADFHAVNYYSRTAVAGLKDGTFDGVCKNDLGWEIYPEGLIICAKELDALVRLPIYVTENGTCDNNDAFRARFIYEHLREIANSELPFIRYYHWCFVDNFEWLEGMSARFGLVELHPGSLERTVKASGRFYSELIANGGADAAMLEKYCAREYHK